MIPRKTLKTCLQMSLVGVSLFALAACQPTADVFIENDIPHAQLGENVTPSAYRIDMRINPDEVGYSGVVEIDITIDKPTTQIWLHGKEMTVPKASFTPVGGEAIALTFTEIAAADAPSGVSRLNSDEVLPSGKGVLKMHYETPFNLALNSAYKVCLLYTSPSPRDQRGSRMPSSA